MATQEPAQQPSLTALPRLEDIARKGDGYDPDGVREAFEAFRRHAAQLQAQLRVLQAASRSGQTVEPTGHAVRMDALHLIRSAAEFADAVETDAQRASEAQVAKTEEEVRRRRRELQDREASIDRYRQESERQRAEMLTSARDEARELLGNANRDATQELRNAEAKGSHLLEQARHQATELTNAARAEVEQTLEWSRT
jgi:F0F1-type ATP synthase membrane subunit b/b'